MRSPMPGSSLCTPPTRSRSVAAGGARTQRTWNRSRARASPRIDIERWAHHDESPTGTSTLEPLGGGGLAGKDQTEQRPLGATWLGEEGDPGGRIPEQFIDVPGATAVRITGSSPTSAVTNRRCCLVTMHGTTGRCARIRPSSAPGTTLLPPGRARHLCAGEAPDDDPAAVHGCVPCRPADLAVDWMRDILTWPRGAPQFRRR